VIEAARRAWLWVHLRTSYRFRVQTKLAEKIRQGRRISLHLVHPNEVANWRAACEEVLRLYFSEQSPIYSQFRDLDWAATEQEELAAACATGISYLEAALDAAGNPDHQLNSPQRAFDNSHIRYPVKGGLLGTLVASLLYAVLVGGDVSSALPEVVRSIFVQPTPAQGSGASIASPTPTLSPTPEPTASPSPVLNTTTPTLVPPEATPTSIPQPTPVPLPVTSPILDGDSVNVGTIRVDGTCRPGETIYFVMESRITRTVEVAREFWIQALIECPTAGGPYRNRAFMCFDGGEYVLHIWREAGTSRVFPYGGKQSYPSKLNAWWYRGQALDYESWHQEAFETDTGGRPPEVREIIWSSPPFIFEWDSAFGDKHPSCGPDA